MIKIETTTRDKEDFHLTNEPKWNVRYEIFINDVFIYRLFDTDFSNPYQGKDVLSLVIDKAIKKVSEV